MDAIEKAKELVETISRDPRCVRLQAARAAAEADGALQSRIQTWNVRKEQLSTAMRQPVKDPAALIEQRKALSADYDALMAEPLMAELHTAQSELNGLLMQINNMIQRAVSGEVDADGCGGDCGGCPGCH
ncbi:YlbF family regulator [Ethanoligenens harbinense]|uniref:YlbF family regulator n=1 Tax=Ethanoligenens harbinense (strain DSM 18485 / JCM 12961 / CGMCC 1.5033 / YUAN-3) TaxID=663278 RepID=E6U2G8_ETHHY|nr:YlbF family regulator [Ethanoligenens harbinense]ADU26259.1 hypothetical protein Ethha_0690 [Ethanoligenens harbinense YUAN-3]AVQ95393.1 YlbF family regulator [Ethanoligenens harbinense YUAN-3]AYF38058.1 YlbF family regulator [Ethanoligenens harbinense]AYF40803.1 YlbF family regulator [Ethanoligenens harbinense]QCN91634.1 YlbF family regulator [Ethanoligenens harbinense]